MKKFVIVIACLTLLISCGNKQPRRDADGRIHRSQEAKAAFKRLHPCPATRKSHGACPGYVIDHVKPLACGGDDAPSNMQWQTVEDAKAKDKWELKVYCGNRTPEEDREWLLRMAELEDGCDCTAGSSVGWNENVWNGPGVSPMSAPSSLVFRIRKQAEGREIRVNVPAEVVAVIKEI
jgi:hypothetical protein